ncbi:unnamed protein product [Ranitomeya imitator]|uniref:Reverse transcriptase domain-containing protein n=1 Tax=Ranitomeya imitator TaxID=111125 RepID=A0ABN9LA05_9NEOB|nr:unnamed protein product [Ranitomeya imitator]
MNCLNKFILVKDLYLFCRQLTFKLLYHQPSVLDTFSDNERQVFRDLLELLQENEGSPSQGIGSIFERPCIYVDHFLQPLVTSLKSYTRDSTHLLQLIEDCVVPEDVLLISMDVEALYTSIAHSAGIHAVTYFLAKSTGGITEHDRFILSLLYFILDKNYFVFDRKFFRQLSGTAMGARCAPSYANLFLGWWEETTVFLHPLFGTMACTWQRYIDDILMIWTGSLEDCNQIYQ